MSTLYRNQFLIRACVEADNQINYLAKRISSDRFLEIGDDPDIVGQIEEILVRINNKIRSLESYFDLGVIPLSKANIYFLLIKQMNETLQYLRDVRKKDYGSQRHTREFLVKLTDCAESVNAVTDLVSANTEIMH